MIALLVTLIGWVVCLAALVGLVDVLRRPAAAFPAVDRQSKVFWAVILGLSAVLVSPPVGFSVIGLLGIIALVAVGVYYADVRPRVAEVTRRR
jgi:predicted CDP-diglyceride synthetase/phosphatidate cytidylyltransferase